MASNSRLEAVYFQLKHIINVSITKKTNVKPKFLKKYFGKKKNPKEILIFYFCFSFDSAFFLGGALFPKGMKKRN